MATVPFCGIHTGSHTVEWPLFPSVVEDVEAAVSSKNMYSLSAVCGMSVCKGEAAEAAEALCLPAGRRERAQSEACPMASAPLGLV